LFEAALLWLNRRGMRKLEPMSVAGCMAMSGAAGLAYGLCFGPGLFAYGALAATIWVSMGTLAGMLLGSLAGMASRNVPRSRRCMAVIVILFFVSAVGAALGWQCGRFQMPAGIWLEERKTTVLLYTLGAAAGMSLLWLPDLLKLTKKLPSP
jgi:hypothetical protein